MFKIQKIIIWFLSIIVVFLSSFAIYYYLIRIPPMTLSLNGKENIILNFGDQYTDEGIKVYIEKKLVTRKITIESNINYNLVGSYYIKYSLKYHKKVKSMTRNIIIVDQEAPIITLNGDHEITIYQNDQYNELGYTAIDNYDQDITKQVVITGEVNTSILGDYLLTYTVTDANNNTTFINRIIKVIERPKPVFKYNSFDNTSHGWSLKYNGHERPTAYKSISYFKSYQTYYIGPNQPIIYLSFDDGGNAISYINQIVDLLNKYEIKATFFFTRNYFLNHADLINKILYSGHLIGNHTYHHLSMPTLATEAEINKFYAEIKDTEAAYKKVTNREMEKLFRYPKGEWSTRSLKIMADLGYKGYFWSATYLDWDKQYTKEEALNHFMALYHNGAIYLIHANNVGNYEALEDFIINMKNLGYSFGLLNTIE